MLSGNTDIIFGSPEEHLGPLTSLTLDLRRLGTGVVGYVVESTAKPALYLIGPLPGEIETDNVANLSGYPTLLPTGRAWSGGVVTFTFQNISPGYYRAVVVPARIEMQAVGGGRAPARYQLPSGDIWDGWTLNVLHGVTIPDTDIVLGVDDTPQDQIYNVGQNVAPHPSLTQGFAAEPPAEAVVLLDGNQLEIGTPEMSGEILEIRAPEGATVDLVIEPLLSSLNKTLYETYLVRTSHIEDGVDIHRYTSAGPIDNIQYAVYFNHSTLGQLPTNANGRVLNSAPVIRKPKPANQDPLFEYMSTTAVDVETDNVYQKASYLVTPQMIPLNLAGEEDTEWRYQTKPIITMLTEVNEHINPYEDIRVLNRIQAVGGVYRRNKPVLTENSPVAIFDLPLASVIKVYVDGVLSWWGKTRLIPLILNPERYMSISGRQISSYEEYSLMLRDIWTASTEATRLWKCSFPGTGVLRSAPPSMQEFVLVYLLVSGNGGLYMDGADGGFSVKVGDTSYSGRTDNSLRRRLSELAHLLSICQESMEIFPESTTYMTHSDPGSLAPKEFRETMHTISSYYAPFNYSDEEYLPTHSNRRKNIPPLEMRRFFRY